MASSGSHFTLNWLPRLMLVSKNNFSPTLNTSVSSPNGKPSVTPGLDRQYSRRSSRFNGLSKRSDQFVIGYHTAKIIFEHNGELPVLVDRIIFKFRCRVVISVKPFVENERMDIADINCHARLVIVIKYFKLIAHPYRHHKIDAIVVAREHIRRVVDTGT